MIIRKNPKISFLSSNSKEAKSSAKKLKKIYSGTSPENADVIVALGGDGFALATLHKFINKNIPIFGMISNLLELNIQ